MDRHHSGLWAIRGTGAEGAADPCALQGPARRLSESLMKKRRMKGLNLKWDWSSVQQNPRITIKETGIGFYYFHQMMLKKPNGKTQDPPLVRGKQAKAFRVSLPQPGPCFRSARLLPFSRGGL